MNLKYYIKKMHPFQARSEFAIYFDNNWELGINSATIDSKSINKGVCCLSIELSRSCRMGKKISFNKIVKFHNYYIEKFLFQRKDRRSPKILSIY